MSSLLLPISNRITIGSALKFKHLREIMHLNPKKKNRNAPFFSNFSAELQPQFNFKIPEGRSWSTF